MVYLFPSDAEIPGHRSAPNLLAIRANESIPWMPSLLFAMARVSMLTGTKQP
jgi:hypothetical protein